MTGLRLRWVVCATALVAIACVPRGTAIGIGVGSGMDPALEAPLPAVTARRLDTTAWVDRTLESLTLRQRVGQMVTIWLLGDYTAYDDSLFAQAIRQVENDGVGGVTISLGTPVEVAHKLNVLQGKARVPLLVSSDLEPSLMRLESAIYPAYMLETGGATGFPPAMAIGASTRDEDAYDVAKAIAEEARAVGIHVNFAPVVDVNNNPNNPVIGTRSFGEDPARVARLAGLFVKGSHDGGVLATAKHFPGHGDTDVDSHVGLPVVTASPERFRTVELVPYRTAVAAGVDLVMSAHIALPAFGGDSATPATLRPDIMRGLLRDSLGFKGVAITDALSMEGVGKGYAVEQAAVMAVQAGADILLKPTDVTRTIDAVVAAVEQGALSRERIDASVRAILTLKARAGLARRRVVSIDSVNSVVGSKAHRATADSVAARAITLLRDSAAALPIATESKVAIVQFAPETELKAGRVFAREFTRLHPGARVVGRVVPGMQASTLDSIARAVGSADVVIFAMHVRRVEGEGRATIAPHVAQWVDSIASARRSVIVAFGNPYVIRQMPRVPAYIMTFGVTDVLEMAAARTITGTLPFRGKSPVSLPGFFAVGDGLAR
jgi:beta-N-acetylhexosaminidase